MSLGNADVAVPVTVQLRDGHIIGAYVDYDGAPWMFTDSEANVWDVDGDEWTRDADTETAAVGWLALLLKGDES